MAAAVHWARGGSPDDGEAQRALAAFGALPDEVAAARRERGDEADAFGVWPEHVQAVRVFSCLSTQWSVVAGTSGVIYLGLRYDVIPAVLQMTGIDQGAWPELFAALRTMEGAALPQLNSER